MVFPDVLARALSIMPKSLVMEAVQRDFLQVLDAFLEVIPGGSLQGLAMYAFSLNNIKFLEYLKTKRGVLDDSLLFTMAITAITGNRKEAFENAIMLGLKLSSRNESGENLLTIAVLADNLDIAEYLLESCRFDPNTPNIFYDSLGCRTVSNAIHFAKSPTMISLLAEKGADVNAKSIKETDHGVTLKSETALHNSASIEGLPLFDALIKAGADFNIPNAVGHDTKTFHDEVYLRSQVETI